MIENAYVDKDRGLIVDSLKVELYLLVVPFIRYLKFCPEPGVFHRAVFSNGSLYTCLLSNVLTR